VTREDRDLHQVSLLGSVDGVGYSLGPAFAWLRFPGWITCSAGVRNYRHKRHDYIFSPLVCEGKSRSVLLSP
ncbi:MAG: hypothetical protein ACE5JU_19255, partial [Candidatus Binatia bacterium]